MNWFFVVLDTVSQTISQGKASSKVINDFPGVFSSAYLLDTPLLNTNLPNLGLHGNSAAYLKPSLALLSALVSFVLLFWIGLGWNTQYNSRCLITVCFLYYCTVALNRIISSSYIPFSKKSLFWVGDERSFLLFDLNLL